METSGKGTLGLKTEFYYSINEIDVYNIDFVTLQATNPNFPAGFILILRGITTFKWGQTNESSLNAAKQECLSLGYEEGSSSHIFFKNKEDGRRVFKAFKRLFELLEKDAKFEDKTAIEDKF